MIGLRMTGESGWRLEPIRWHSNAATQHAVNARASRATAHALAMDSLTAGRPLTLNDARH